MKKLILQDLAPLPIAGDYTMQEIANCFDVHYATVSRAVKRVEGNV